MFMLTAAALLATAAMIGVAHATPEQDYLDCMAGTGEVFLEGLPHMGVSAAIAYAEPKCMKPQVDAETDGRLLDALVGRLIAFKEYGSKKPIEVAEAKPQIENVSGFTPSQSWNPYNARTGYLCQFPLDSEPMRQLVEAGRLDEARQKPGCVIVEQPIEVEKVRQFGRTMQVRYTNVKGQMIEAFTSDWTFRTQAAWNEIGIE